MSEEMNYEPVARSLRVFHGVLIRLAMLACVVASLAFHELIRS